MGILMKTEDVFKPAGEDEVTKRNQAYNKMEPKTYRFRISVFGYGMDPQQAWEDAVESLSNEPGPHPDDFIIEPD